MERFIEIKEIDESINNGNSYSIKAEKIWNKVHRNLD
jgi:hypothetical protein